MRSSGCSLPDPSRGSVRAASAARTAGLMAALVAIVLAACGTGGGTTSTAPATAPVVSGAWVRTPQGMDLPAAGYFVITGGNQADALVGATSPAAGSVTIHETSTGASGMAGMHPVPRLDVPAGGTVTFEPGGYHLMLMDLTGTLAAGDTVRIDLVFERAGTISVQAQVRQG